MSRHDMPLSPLIIALIDQLPAPGSMWPLRQRNKWLKAAESIFVLLYTPDETETPGDPS